MMINPYRKSVSPFVSPLPVPVCDPDFEPVTVSVSCRWLSYILGALSLLNEQATWDTTDPDEMLLAVQRTNNLRAIFTAAGNDSACDELPPAFSCKYDFEISDGGWSVIRTAEYVEGSGWLPVPSTSGPTFLNGLWITKSITPTTLTQIKLTLNALQGSLQCAVDNDFYVESAGVEVESFLENQCDQPNGDRVITLSFPATLVDTIGVFWYVEYSTIDGDHGSLRIKTVEIKGFSDDFACE